MDLTNFIMLAVERNMISNKYGLDLFYRVFKESSKPELETCGGGTSYLKDHDFFRAIQYLAKSLFADDESPVEKMFEKLLID